MYFQDADKHKEEFVLLADKEGIILSINSQFRKNFDYDVTDVVGQSFKMLFHPISIEVIIDDLLNTLSNGEIWNGYLKRVPKNGEPFWVHSTISPIEPTGGFLSSCRKVLEEEIPLIDSLYQEIFLLEENSLVFIDVTLSHYDKQHSYHIDSNNMKELMEKVKIIISNLISDGSTFDIILFDSNIFSLDNFTKLMAVYLPSSEK